MSTPLDVIVVGGGIAGMTYATQLADRAGERSVRIRILSKAAVQVSNSYHAQGGVAAVMRREDSFMDHVRDTLVVGGGRNDADVVRIVVQQGPALIRGLIGLGAHFDREPGGALQLAREGGHSTARVVHHRDRTGEEIVRVLQQRVKGTPTITVVPDQRAIDLVMEGDGSERRCIGVRAVDLCTGDLTDHFAHAVVLATGGAGRLYEHTTNPPGATGDGIAMGIRAGARTRDMAFVQFHPTALYTGKRGTVNLISEAVRGAGARLLGADKQPLMAGVHPMGDLAPRHVVARAIHREMVRAGVDHVWLDVSPIGIHRFTHEFPGIARHCRDAGLLPGRDLLPVMPVAHYMCGGLRTDDCGRTSIAGLYALGECAGSGLHGADRLASNSLLEALVIPERAAGATLEASTVDPVRSSCTVMHSRLAKRPVEIVDRAMGALTHGMTTHAGIVRNAKGLESVLRVISCIERQLQPIWHRRRWSPGLMDLRDLLVVARSLTEAAMREPVSVGAHYMEEVPVSC